MWIGACSTSRRPAAGAGAAPATSTAVAATSTVAPPASFTLAATGDLLMHEPVTRAAQAAAGGTGYDFRPLLADVRPIISAADLAICHMETPLSRDDKRITYFPTFVVPNEIAAAASWAGYDTRTTASNHTLDQGSAGVQATLDILDAVHLMHVGTARRAAEPSWLMYQVHGVRVAHLDYTYGLNGLTVPKDKPWLVNIIDPRRILADAHTARLAGAQFVVVAMHWGLEYQSAPTAEQRAQARTLLASPDIDFLYGGHVHVIQPIEQIAGKYVVYGIGNFLAKHALCCDTPQTRDGMILQLTVTATSSGFAVSRLSYVPTYVDPQTMKVLPVMSALGQPAVGPQMRHELVDSFQRTVSAINALGADRLGVRPDGGIQ